MTAPATDPQESLADGTTAVLRAAIKDRAAVAFVYQRADGAITRHNAVYPRMVFQHGFTC